MHPLWILALSSFLFALVTTPLCRNLFKRWGIVDHPDETRKLHAQPIPLLGGVPIVIAYVASFTLVKWLEGRGAQFINYSLVMHLGPAVAVIFIAGILDDRFGLKAPQKLATQLLAAGWAYAAGVRITGIAGHQLASWLSGPITIVWLIGCTNAFNLIDGVDGLAAGVGLFATVTTLIAALLQHNFVLAAATAPLVGALIGFLRYNFNPATIFLGDSGSLFIGFLLGCFGVIWSEKSTTILGMAAPLMALSIPILDVMLSIVRRFLRRRPIFDGDRGHIHHRLLDRGLSPRKVVLLLYGICAIGAVFSLLQSMAPNRFAGIVVIAFCAVAWIGIQNLGYAEFEHVRRLILSGGFRDALNSQLALDAFVKELSAAPNDDERWEILQDGGRKLGFTDIRWQTGGRLYAKYLAETNDYRAWELRVSLPDDDYVRFSGGEQFESASLNVTVFADSVRTALASKALSKLADHLANGISVQEAFASRETMPLSWSSVGKSQNGSHRASE